MKKTPSIDETVVSAEINGKIVWENLFKDVKNYILKASEQARSRRRTLNTIDIGTHDISDSDFD